MPDRIWTRVAKLRWDDLKDAIEIVKSAIEAGIYKEDMSEAIFMSLSPENGRKLAQEIEQLAKPFKGKV